MENANFVTEMGNGLKKGWDFLCKLTYKHRDVLMLVSLLGFMFVVFRYAEERGWDGIVEDGRSLSEKGFNLLFPKKD